MRERFFNNAGPNQPDIHYTLDPLSRWDLDGIMALIDARRYFILHAPRQTGKTSCMLALEAHLNAGGTYRCLYVNVETAQAARENVVRGMGAIVSAYASRARMGTLKDDRPTQWLAEAWAESQADNWLATMLERHSAADPKPLVILFDEVDALIGDTLISFLRQIRSGYPHRPSAFPQALVLCGLRDVRDYRIHSKHTQEIITGGSAFNIKAESLRLADFTPEDIATLYAMHTTETGQDITQEARELVWHYTEGQPWLVNALIDTAVRTMKENRDRSIPITGEIMREAAERLIQSRAVHLDQLADKLTEDRVKRVIEPIVSNGDDDMTGVSAEDVQYVRDLGLIAQNRPYRIANAIYQEVIPRELTWVTQGAILREQPPFVRADQSLDLSMLLRDFQAFFRAQGESWAERYSYKESGPQLILQAFLQRIINGDGRVEREYGLGRGRTDLLVSWPKGPSVTAARYSTWQKEVIEAKVVKSMGPKFWENALAQTSEYAARCAAQKAHLLIFDKRESRTWEQRIFEETRVAADGRAITVWGM
jgi:AAA-like domain